MTTTGFSVARERVGTCVVVHVVGEIDMATGPVVWEMIDDTVQDGDTLVIDLAGTTFMDSTGLGLVIRASGAYGPEHVKIRAPRPRVLALLDLTGMRQHITIIEAGDLHD